MEHRAYGWGHAESSYSHGYLLPAVLALLARHVGRGARLLDLGCGNGAVTARLAAEGYRMVGVDVSEDGVLHARKAYPDVRFELASVNDDDLAARVGTGFDGVISLEVIEHLFYPKRLFTQSHAVLRSGGALVLSTPYHGYVKNLAISLVDGWDKHFGVDWDGGHIKFFSDRTLRRMAEGEGFRDIRFQGVGRLPMLWKSTIMTARR
jgi:2-polyprenyl-3-methyl-5-hydroxy-6-metoxy-1,4-benzoquinol methylase